MLNFLPSITLLDLFEIVIISFIFYGLFLLIRDTRAVQGLKVLALLIIVSFICQIFEFETINWMMRNLWTILPVAFVILFQPELRRAIGEMDRYAVLKALFKQELILIPEMVKSVMWLSAEKRGALIAIKQSNSLKHFLETGIKIDAKISAELLNTIFSEHSPLHDGCVIIQGERISAASCVLPLSQDSKVELPSLGTRHRAGIGLSEETDALVIIVSEETGKVSIAIHGRLLTDLDETSLTEMLTIYQSKDNNSLVEDGA